VKDNNKLFVFKNEITLDFRVNSGNLYQHDFHNAELPFSNLRAKIVGNR
jgi:hypothetical protein